MRTGKVLNETLLGEDVATGAISSSEVLNSTLTHFDLGADSVRYAELDPLAFDPAEIAEVAPGFVFGIANDSIQSDEVSADSLTGADVATNSLTGSDIDETSLSALDGNDAHDQSCDPATDSYLHCVELSFTAGRPMSVLMMAIYQYHGVDDNPRGRCRTTLDGAGISSAKLYNSDHTSEIGGSQVESSPSTPAAARRLRSRRTTVRGDASCAATSTLAAGDRLGRLISDRCRRADRRRARGNNRPDR